MGESMTTVYKDTEMGELEVETTFCAEVEGIPVSIDMGAFTDDIETLELLGEIEDGNAFALTKLMRHLFGDEQYANIKASLRKGGRTSVSDMTGFMSAVFEQIGGAAKN